MGDFRAIGGVSATLQTLLHDRMELPNGVLRDDMEVTISTPREQGTAGEQTAETPRINLFLFQIAESSYLKNRDLSGRGDSLDYGLPPLSLTLNYLITAYGSTIGATDHVNELQAHFLLGSAMRVLHDYAIITPQLQTIHSPIGQSILHDSLRREFEEVKLTLDPINLEDLSKIWTALTSTFRLSVAYSASVVQIESLRARRYPRLVGEPPLAGPRVFTVPHHSPGIQAIHVRRQGDPPDSQRTTPYAQIGDTLIILGENFTAGRMAVVFNSLEFPVSPISGQRIELTIPDSSYAGDVIPAAMQLQPGTVPVEIKVGLEGFSRAGFHSNRAAFVLVPRITAVDTAAPQTVTITGTRLFHPDLHCLTLIGPALFPSDVYQQAAPTRFTLLLPDTLPHRQAACLVAGIVNDPLPNLGPAPELAVTIGVDGPHTVSLAQTPATLAQAAEVLQAAIRTISTTNPTFTLARVTVVAGQQLVVVPGGLADPVEIADTHHSQAASLLGFGAGVSSSGYLSGAMTPFPRLSAGAPALQITIGNVAATVQLAGIPHTASEAAALLEAALRNTSANPGFANARVTVLAQQLLILAGNNGPIRVSPVAGIDDTTAAQLQLQASYPLRVRVNGAESLGDMTTVELPL